MSIRLRASLIVEYTANPAYYPGGSTPEQMAAIDHDLLKNDPLPFFDDAQAEITKVEVIS